ncbi:hypothetical protein [Methanocella arvoryzae]|uniref:hypothetical protein n=1 Tax=Methanocella arvoryzae TaxID=1175445 RepID=UPI001E3425A2|nr:hypothetical protein [Methanocella arvoryzae]
MLALLIIAILLAGTVQVAAWKAAKTKWVIGDIVYGNEVVLQKPSQTLFHQQTLATSDTEAIAIAFPAALSITGVAPAFQAGLTITQTSDAAILATDTGFYTANWCFNCFSNNGGWAVGDIAAMSPIRSASMVGSGLIWPYMNTPDPTAGYTVMRFKPYINSSESPGNISISPGAGLINNTVDNATSPTVVGTNNSTAAWKSKEPINYKTATKEQIRNASGLERMWRNANLANTVPKSYNGSVERPTWINPSPDVLKMADRNKVLNDSLNMTRPGEKAHTLFWDL